MGKIGRWHASLFSRPLQTNAAYFTGRRSRPLSLERSRIVQDRSAITNITQKLFVLDEYGRTTASAEDRITIQIEDSLDQDIRRDISNNNYYLRNEQREVTIEGHICAIWCVGALGHITRSASVAIKSVEGTLRDLIEQFSVMQQAEGVDSTRTGTKRNRRGRQRIFSSDQTDLHQVRRGDICTLLQPQTDEGDLYCMLVSHFWRPREGVPSQSVLWIRRGGSTAIVMEDSPKSTRAAQFKVAAAHSVDGTPYKVYSHPTDPRSNDAPKSRLDSVTLKDGRRYVVYRFLLYCDDFKESASNYFQSSAGGVYPLPLGMSLKAKSSRTAVHVISLTPPGVSTNQILHQIKPDLVKGTKEGVVGKTPTGMDVVIFLDVIGYIVDYPAAAAPVGVVGYSGDAPCTHCNIRKLKGGGSSQMGHTTNVHAVNTGTLRCGERHIALRNCQITNQQANRLDVKQNSEVNERNCPLLDLQREMEAAQPHIPRASFDRPVVSGSFDAYRSNLIAPDHLLTGLARNVLDLCFQVLSPELRKRADLCICAALADNGLFREKTIFNHNKLQLHSTSLSALYCILLVAPPVLRNIMDRQTKTETEALRLLKDFQKLVAMTHWNPPPDCDGEPAYLLPRMQEGRPYMEALQGLAESYVSNADAFCKHFPEVGSILDKPNLHRILELYHHTIPAFGHVCHAVELVFEAAHQPLKRCISRGNHHDAEVSPVVHCMGNDWQSRLALLRHFIESSDGEQRACEMRGLRRMLLGKGEDYLEADSSESTLFLQQVDEEIRKLFVTPLLYILKSNGNVNTALAGRTSGWLIMKSKPPEVARKFGTSTNLLRGASQF